MACDQLLDPFSRRCDDGEQPHRFMIRHVAVHHGLPGQSDSLTSRILNKPITLSHTAITKENNLCFLFSRICMQGQSR